MNSDLSTAFSVDDDVSFIYNKIRKNDSYAYKLDEHTDMMSTGIDNQLDMDDETHEIIDVKTEKKYSYGLATVYIIVILLVANTLLSNITNYKKKAIEDSFLDSYKLISDEIIEMKRENEMMSQKLSEIELDLSKKSEHQRLYDDVHGRQNYMNYKFGTQLIKEKTSESCQTDSKVIATDLLTPIYMNDDTINWDCKHDKYCTLGIHFDTSINLDRIIYEYGNIIKNIQRIKVYYELDDDLVLHEDYFCNSSSDYEILNIENKSIKVQNIEIQLYPTDKHNKCLRVNNLIINAL